MSNLLLPCAEPNLVETEGHAEA